MPLSVRVKGRTIDQYQHDGKVYIEGRKGSEYTLYFHNNSSTRKKIVLSVDGLNVMTGDKTWERAYVVEPWGDIEVPGWRHNESQAKAFQFSSIKGSYNQQNDEGEKKNIGVIGCLVYNEKPRPVPVQPVHIHHDHYHWPKPYWPPYPYIGDVFYNNPDISYQNAQSTYTMNAGQADAGFGGVATASCSSGETKTSGGPIAANMMTSLSDPISSRTRSMRLVSTPEPEQSIGTGYGRTKEFKTTQVYYDFESSPCETILIYYESKENLYKLGVLERRRWHNPEREAFPGYVADGCPAPKYVRKRQ